MSNSYWIYKMRSNGLAVGICELRFPLFVSKSPTQTFLGKSRAFWLLALFMVYLDTLGQTASQAVPAAPHVDSLIRLCPKNLSNG